MATAVEKRNEARVKELTGKISNKDKREAIKMFDCAYEDMDELDASVLLAYIACDRNRTLEELDALPLTELQTIIGLED